MCARLSVSVATLSIVSALVSATPQARAAELDLPAQPLSEALRSLGDQTNMNVLFDPDTVQDRQAPAIQGASDLDDALSRLLDGSGLTYRFVDERTVTLIPTVGATGWSTRPNGPEATSLNSLSTETRLSRLESSRATESSAANHSKPTNSADVESGSRATSDIQEVIVTGTHIRGAKDPASPIYSYTREEIDLSGAGTVQDFLDRVPGNYPGAANENTTQSKQTGANGATTIAASGVNLRGLGSDATLVLLNGYRLAPSSSSGSFVDISQIPVAAIERIEVLPDGASAVYGSDAVGGVINFVLRDDFDGAETRARFGSVTNGNREEWVLGQTIGQQWSSGSGLISYEYLHRSRLRDDDRSFSNTAFRPSDLLPLQKRHSAFARVNQHILPNLNFFTDGHYARRSVNYFNAQSPVIPQENDATTKAYSVRSGVEINAGRAAQVDLAIAYANDSTDFVATRPNTLFSSTYAESSILMVDGKIDGVAFDLPSGEVKYALGGQYRSETFQTTNRLTSNRFEPDRNVRALFAELLIPLLGATSRGNANRIELSLADRWEDYSDFGSTNNPKVGLTWRPINNLKFRTTYGTSFKAPLLSDLNPIPSSVIPLPMIDPVAGSQSCLPFSPTSGCTHALVLFGGNPDLNPQEATSWTAGIDFHSTDVPGFNASVTYYDTRFKDRITNAQAVLPDILSAFQAEQLLGPAIVRRNATLQEIEQGYAASTFSNVFGIPVTSVRAIVDSRRLNLSTVSTKGFDFNASYRFQSALGSWEAGIDGSYILDYELQFSETSPVEGLLNTVGNPIDLKVRATVLLNSAQWSSALFVNYIDSYKDIRTGQRAPVRSWTTVDASIRYQFPNNSELLRGASIALIAINMFDAEPPFVLNTANRVHFDGANASPLGRFLAVEFTKAW